jgi:hypothetical protein
LDELEFLIEKPKYDCAHPPPKRCPYPIKCRSETRA